MISTVWTSVALLLSASVSSAAFNPTGNTNLAAYWGQNSYGATHTSDTANWQTNLAHYCQDDVVDIFPLAFLDVFFGIGSLPEINLANTCNDVDDAVFPGSDLANCQFMATDIQTCQAAGKIITLSMGGATGADTFTSESQAEDFADLIWDLFLGGTSSTRPFGDAVLDGIDLDIEGGGTANFAAFVTRIRTLAEGASKPYYITGAPQCPFPDANLDTVLNAVGFDAVYVQFYNNFCEVSNFNVAGDWDFSDWDNWAKTTSPNPDVKVYIGAPASSTAASNGYVDASTLGTILQTTKATYSSFGGAMLWDISQAYANGRYDQAVKTALLGGSSAPTTSVGSTTTTKTTSSSATSTTSVVTNGDCAGVSAWVSTVAYVGGSQVTYNGHLWTANYWSEADVPGGVSGDWADDGVCTTDATLLPAIASSTLIASTTAHISAASVANSVSVQAQPSAASSATALPVFVSSTVSAARSVSIKAQPSVASSAPVSGPAVDSSVASATVIATASSTSVHSRPLVSASATQASITASSLSVSAAVFRPSSNATNATADVNVTETSIGRRSRFFRF
ncbi:glycoside hydrolase superfamily [Lentinula aciculospora]|uniref:chitinase n=1 Tax=Lentinula aciculospora TaxID=153920 RepID=A0A9W9AE85_9AGAR|nr:glycoside hydrolase superfamily [Lentinula aciculospora]